MLERLYVCTDGTVVVWARRAQEPCCVVKKVDLRPSPLWPEFPSLSLSAGFLGVLEVHGTRFCGHD